MHTHQDKESNPQEIPTRQYPDKVDPTQDPDLKPSKENPKNPRTDDTGLNPTS